VLLVPVEIDEEGGRNDASKENDGEKAALAVSEAPGECCEWLTLSIELLSGESGGLPPPPPPLWASLSSDLLFPGLLLLMSLLLGDVEVAGIQDG
jgi:hypothetical protein